ncbi:MAG: Protein oar [Thermoanaerobaculia bacterium]|nr:Protein oar [Thermoanaerobaculia bacterium]
MSRFGRERDAPRAESKDFRARPRNGLARRQFAPGSGPLAGNDFNGLLTDEKYRRNAWQLSGSVTLGNHEVKLGGSYDLENPNRTSWYNQGEAIFPSYSPDGGTVLGVWHQYLAAYPLNCKQLWDGRQGDFGPVPWYDCATFQPASAVRSDFRTRNASAFVQDTWRPLSNLTIKAGLRYDFQEFVHTNGDVVLELTDQWSPRLSVAWDFGGKGRTKLFASYGRYYQAIPLQFQALMMSNEYRIFAWNLSPGPDLVGLGGAVNFGVYVTEGLKGSYQDEVSAGAEAQLGSSWSVGVRGTYRSRGRALEDRCDRYWPSQGIYDLFPPDNYQTCALVNPGEGGRWGEFRDPADPRCFADYPTNEVPIPCETVRANRYYRGVEVAVQHRPSKDLYLQASYVYSKLVGNFEGAVSSYPSGTYQ